MHTTQFGTGTFGRIEDLHLSRSERLRINAYIHDGEVIAEFLSRVVAGVRFGAGSLARAVKALFAHPARH